MRTNIEEVNFKSREVEADLTVKFAMDEEIGAEFIGVWQGDVEWTLHLNDVSLNAIEMEARDALLKQMQAEEYEAGVDRAERRRSDAVDFYIPLPCVVREFNFIPTADQIAAMDDMAGIAA